jgi:GMP synthase-like glutamine amidotransferase
MRALFIEHDHCEPPGPVGDRFAERGFDVTEFLVVPQERSGNPGVEVDFPDPAQFDVIVAMGAPWSAYDHALIGSWLLPELDLLRAAHQAGIGILGICFGGQAIALALGGSVTAAPEPEIGWYQIQTSAPSLIEAGPWLQYHYDRWQPPPGATTLARTALAPQAFVTGTSLAVQFHPETTSSMLVGWLDNGGYAELAGLGLDAAALLEQTRQLELTSAARARRLVDGFIDTVARRGRPADETAGPASPEAG